MLYQARRRPLLKRLALVAGQESQALAGWRVEAVEQNLGQSEVLTVLAQDGQTISISGRLDRLETSGDQLRVCDYKHTSNDATLRSAVKKEDFGRTVFQIPLYLAAARLLWPQKAGELFGRLVPTRQKLGGPREIELPGDDPLVAPGPAGEPPQILQQVAALWQAMGRGEFPAQPEAGQCGLCGWQGACRALPPADG